MHIMIVVAMVLLLLASTQICILIVASVHITKYARSIDTLRARSISSPSMHAHTYIIAPSQQILHN